MIGWIFVGAMVCSVVAVSVLIFFKGASPQQTVLEQKWENVEKEMLPEYNFKFYGDCGAPRSLEKKFKPLFFSSNSMMGAIQGAARVDVYDFTISDGRGMDATRVHGLILLAEKHMVNLDSLKYSTDIGMNSSTGDYQVVQSPNQNYLYILIVDEEYFPITYESVDWYAATNKETLKKNLSLIYKYMDKFCLVEREAA